MNPKTLLTLVACLVSWASAGWAQPSGPAEIPVPSPSQLASDLLAKLGNQMVAREGFIALPPDGTNRVTRLVFYSQPQTSLFGVCRALTVDMDLRGSEPYDLRADQTYYIARPPQRKDTWSDQDRDQMATTCSNLKPSAKFFAAPSPQVAWKAGYLLASAAARAQAKTGTRIECNAPDSFSSQWCGRAREELANLQTIPIWRVENCAPKLTYEIEPSCILIRMHSGRDSSGRNSPVQWTARLTGTKELESIAMRPAPTPPDYFLTHLAYALPLGYLLNYEFP